MREDVPPFDPTDRASFRHLARDVIRFADLDPLGHVNNVAFAVFCESGRVGFFEALGHSAIDPKTGWVAARLTIDFRAPLHFPGEVVIGTRPARLGRTSMVLLQGLFAGGRCVATSHCVSVLFERAGERSIPLPDDLRARLLREIALD